MNAYDLYVMTHPIANLIITSAFVVLGILLIALILPRR